MLKIFANSFMTATGHKKWSSPPHWIEPERRPARGRAAILREQEDRRRWLRDTGTL